MAPALENQTLRVLTDEEILLEFLIRDVGNVGRARDMRIAAIAEFELRCALLRSKGSKSEASVFSP